ncbi:MAG: MFS transporter [Thermoplasmata archaeon]
MNRRAILALASLGAFFALGDRYAISVLYKEFMANLDINSKVLFSLIFSSFYIGYTITQVPGGRLAEKYGPSRIAGFSMISWSILLGILSLDKSFVFALVISFFMGVTQGPIFPSIMYLVRLSYDDHEYARATSYVSALGDVSPAIIPIVAFLLLNFSGYLYLPILVFAFSGIFVGSILLSININYKINKSPGKWKMLMNKSFWIFGLSFFLYDFYFYIFLTWYPAFLSERYGIRTNNFIFFTLPWIFMALSAILSGIVLDAVKNDTGISKLSYIIIFISMLLTFILDNPYEFLILVTVMLSFLNPILLSSWRLSTRIAGKESSAFVGGWINLWGNLGGITAPFVMALLMSLINLKFIFIYSSIVPLCGLITWYWLGGLRNAEKGHN